MLNMVRKLRKQRHARSSRSDYHSGSTASGYDTEGGPLTPPSHHNHHNGAMFEFLPAIVTSRDRTLSRSSPDLLDSVQLQQHRVSIVAFEMVQPPISQQQHHQPTPALVYSTGGKAKSLYTVARPGSIRRFRESASAGAGAPSAIPGTPHSAVNSIYSIPPVPSLKLPSVKKRHKHIPSFNICVAGTPQSGKTSFIRLLCETLDIDREKEGTKKALETVHGPQFGRSTTTSEPASVTLTTNTAFDQRIRLTLFKAAAIEFNTDSSTNLKSDLVALDVTRFIETKFETTLGQETALVREPLTTADQHVHLCLYFLAQHCFVQNPSNSPSSPCTKSDSVKLASDDEDSDEKMKVATDVGTEASPKPGQSFQGSTYAICPRHKTVMHQLAKRVNVIPVIARADEMTISELELAKEALRELTTSDGILYDPLSFTQSGVPAPAPVPVLEPIRERDGHLAVPGDEADSEDHGEELDEPGTGTGTGGALVIRSRSNSVRRSTSRSRNKRFSEISEKPSAAVIERTFPVSFVAPEEIPSSIRSTAVSTHGEKSDLQVHRFVRTFKYGAVNVESEEHCEYTPLKRVLFSTGWKTLKECTEDKYEVFRTERLQERQERRHTASASTPAVRSL